MGIYEDVAALQEQMAAAQTAIAALQSSVAATAIIEIAANTDLNTLTDEGCYLIPSATVCATLTNKPTTSNATGFVRVIKGGDVGQRIMYYLPCNKSDASYYQRCYYENTWGAFHEIACNDSGWLDLPLADGMTAYSEAQKPRYRRIGNEVFLCGVFIGVTASNTVVATLPSGYRPEKKQIVATASVGQMISKFSIETNGELVYNRGTIEPTLSENWHSIACSFVI